MTTAYQRFPIGTAGATSPQPTGTSLVVPTPGGKPSTGKGKESSLRQQMYEVQVRRIRQDVGNWRAALDRAESVWYPDRTQLYNIYADLVLDLHLSSVIETRKISVTSRPFRLVDAAGKENPAATKLLRKPWFRQFMNHALDSIFWGFTLLEFPVPVAGEFAGVDLIDRQYLFPEAGIVRTMPGMITGVSYLEDPRFTPWVLPVGHPRNLGLLNKCAPVGLFKKNVMAAWADFTEVFGMPFRSVSTDAEGKDLDKIEEILASMGQSSYGVFPEDTKVEFIQAATANEQLYNVAIERFNSEMSKGILGQTMTTDNGSSKSQGEVHERVAQAYTRDDCEFLAGLVNTVLLPFMLMHGYQVAGLSFEWDDTESLGKKEQWAIVAGILKQGYRVPSAYITATFGVPIEAAEAAAASGTGDAAGGKGGGPSGGKGGDEPAGGPEVKPILGYHIETGTVNRNEARAQLNLPAEDDTEAERQRVLKGKLSVLAAATGAGVPLEAALKLADLTEVELPPPAAVAPPPPPPSPEERGGTPAGDEEEEEQPGKPAGLPASKAAGPTAALAELYHGPGCSCCGGARGVHLVTAAAPGDGAELEGLLDRLIQLVYASKGKLEDFLDLPLFEYLDTALQDAVTVAWGAKDPALEAHLRANVQHFSGFKTYAVQQEMTRKLYDADGGLVDFEAFQAEALRVNQLYNVDYLRAEYELAVAGAQMASKWADFEPDALLQYRTVGDDLVRPEHVRYDRVTLPAGHSWWLTHYPPNGWRCRCDVAELGPEDGERTPDAELDGLPDVGKQFAHNVGKSGEVFGQEHPYFDVPAADAARVEAAITKATTGKGKKGGRARGK